MEERNGKETIFSLSANLEYLEEFLDAPNTTRIVGGNLGRQDIINAVKNASLVLSMYNSPVKDSNTLSCLLWASAKSHECDREAKRKICNPFIVLEGLVQQTLFFMR